MPKASCCGSGSARLEPDASAPTVGLPVASCRTPTGRQPKPSTRYLSGGPADTAPATAQKRVSPLIVAKNRAGNRIYTNRDIKLILYIKKLLRDERYTIEGAKQVLKTYTPEPDTGEQLELIDAPKPQSKIKDEQLRADVMEVKEFLEGLLRKLS